MNKSFGHEKLEVYKTSIRFVSWSSSLLEDLPKTHSAHKQLERASTSIPLNIAEGNGKFTPADRCRFFDIARGSALECAACLDVLEVKGQISTADEGKEILHAIVSMLIGLVRSVSQDRVHEPQASYLTH